MENFCGTDSRGQAFSTSKIVPASTLQLRAPIVNCVSLPRRVGGLAHRLLAMARRGQHFVKRCICAEFRQQRIGKQILVRAVVLLHRTLQQMQSSLFFPQYAKIDPW